MLRSMPTIAPTKASITTSNENWAAFSRSPSRMTDGTRHYAATVTRWFSRRVDRG